MGRSLQYTLIFISLLISQVRNLAVQGGIVDVNFLDKHSSPSWLINAAISGMSAMSIPSSFNSYYQASLSHSDRRKRFPLLKMLSKINYTSSFEWMQVYWLREVEKSLCVIEVNSISSS